MEMQANTSEISSKPFLPRSPLNDRNIVAEQGKNNEKSLVDLLGATDQFGSKGEIRRLISKEQLRPTGSASRTQMASYHNQMGKLLYSAVSESFQSHYLEDQMTFRLMPKEIQLQTLRRQPVSLQMGLA